MTSEYLKIFSRNETIFKTSTKRTSIKQFTREMFSSGPKLIVIVI